MWFVDGPDRDVDTTTRVRECPLVAFTESLRRVTDNVEAVWSRQVVSC